MCVFWEGWDVRNSFLFDFKPSQSTVPGILMPAVLSLLLCRMEREETKEGNVKVFWKWGDLEKEMEMGGGKKRSQ